MNVREAASEYRGLQKEALSLARELRPLAKRSRELFKKALSLASRLDGSEELYVKDGWNDFILLRLYDFDYGVVKIGPENEPVSMAETLLRNLADEPFVRRGRKTGGAK